MKLLAKPWPPECSCATRALQNLGLASLILLLPACQPDQRNAPAPTVTLNAARDYGYVLGDLIELTLSVELHPGQQLDTASLPQPGPINDWLSLREQHWAIRPAGGRDIGELQLTYQVFKGVRAPELMSVPPLTLNLAGSPPVTLQTPSWSFTLSPVIPPDISDEQLQLLDPIPPKPADTAPLQRRFLQWLSAFGAVVALLCLRHVLRRRKARPFAEAQRTVRRLLAGGNDPATVRAAARALHRALDLTFGETLFASQLERYCLTHATFAPLQPELARFFDGSQALFFDPDSADSNETWRSLNLPALSKACAAAERKAL